MSNPKGQHAKKAVRQATALELRIQGLSYRAIATECGVNMSTAYSDVQHALGLLDDVRREKAEQYRALELLRLDAMTLSLSAKIDLGDTKAILVAVKIMERRAKLLGLDNPQAAEASGPFKFTLDIGTLGESSEDSEAA
ncbi:MAG: sigma factor-like helix-turn-helix DNA-binding protein [Verrucomicrobia bacterium]|nr:sigma factor-like helix-turn-helix DNA-binding protein [Verrucomicrobiota bacterium]